MGKRFTLFISNEDVNDVIEIVKSLEDQDIFIDGVSETVKSEKTSNFFSSKRCKWKKSWKSRKRIYG